MKKALREILNTSLYLLGVLCLVYLVIHFVGQRTQVQGSSMEPMLSTEDNLIVDKLSYRFHDPKRYDIIVFPYLKEEETFYIKRIIGLPGETVQIDEEGNIYVDGESVKLTPIEYNILLLLVKNCGRVFSINQIYESIWNEEAIGADNTVAVHIRHIREKIEINPKEPRYLKVVWGIGYKVEKDA